MKKYRELYLTLDELINVHNKGAKLIYHSVNMIILDYTDHLVRLEYRIEGEYYTVVYKAKYELKEEWQ